jgi:hypothetical protein
MGITVTGVMEVEEMLINLDTDGRKRVVSALYKAALDTRKLARAMAPRDLANLEKAIKVRPEINSGRLRDEFGRFQRTEVEVYIDMDMPVDDPHRKRPATVGDYAWEIHEHLTPYGAKQLGEKSLDKQRRNSGIVVGGGFLERAATEIEQGLDERLRAVLDEIGF